MAARACMRRRTTRSNISVLNCCHLPHPDVRMRIFAPNHTFANSRRAGVSGVLSRSAVHNNITHAGHQNMCANNVDAIQPPHCECVLFEWHIIRYIFSEWLELYVCLRVRVGACVFACLSANVILFSL